MSADAIVTRMTRVREDDRFKTITPESIILPYPGSQPGLKGNTKGGEHELWLDWGFVEFWKSEICKYSSETGRVLCYTNH